MRERPVGSGGVPRTAWASTAAGALALAIALACGKSDHVVGPAGALHAIVVSPSPDTLAVGSSAKLTATGQDATGRTVSGLTFFWSSSDTSIAKITQNGLVTAVKIGQAQIAASVSGVSGVALLVVSPKPVGSILIVPANATLRVATTLQLTDTVKDASGNVLTGQTVTWSSDSAPIAAVDGNGLVTARALGVAHIKATAGGKSATATITVTKVPVASVAINPASPTVYVSQTTQLSAVTKDSAGNVLTGRVVRWSVANTSIATIDSVAGILTGGPDTGHTYVRAQSEGVIDSVVAAVSNAPPSTVIISPSSFTADAGQTVPYSATVTNSLGQVVSNPTVNFTSNNTNVASVTSESGANAQILAGPNTGTATITGTSGAATGTASLIVNLKGVDSVHVSAVHDTLTVGQMETLTAAAYDSSGNLITGRSVTWQSPTGYATVNGGGTVTAQSPGQAVIFATISGVTGSLVLTIGAVPIGSVTISPHSDTVQVLGQRQLTVTVRDINGNIVSNAPQNWYTTNSSVAFVSSTGNVLGVGTGGQPIAFAMIVDSVGGKADTNTTYVLEPATSVTVYPATSTIYATAPNNTVALIDSARDGSGNYLPGTPVTWSPTSGGVATVNAGNGLVTATNTAAGSATITATATQPSGNVNGSATVTVLGHSNAVTVNIPAPATLSLTGTGYPTSTTGTATVLDTFGNQVESARQVTWHSSDSTTVSFSNGSQQGTVTTTAGTSLTGVTLYVVPGGAAEAVTITVTPLDNPGAANTAQVTVVP